MIKNTENQDQQIKLIENLARNLASKRPKETNYNNTKTRKYFGNKILKENDQNSNTIVDSLLANQGKFTEVVSSQKTFIKIPAKFIEEETTLEDSLEDLNENFKRNILDKQNKTFEKFTTTIKNPVKDLNQKNSNLQENSNFEEEDLVNFKDSKKHNLTDINIEKNGKKNLKKNLVFDYPYEKEKLEFFDFFNFESLFNMHKLYSKLMGNFELQNNFFQREKILKKLFEIINSKPYYFPHKMIRFFEDKALSKNLKIYFFIEIVILSMLFHSNINEIGDLYFAFKHCLFYLNQNLLIITHFIVEKLEFLEKQVKKDLYFENFYLMQLNLKIDIENNNIKKFKRSSAVYDNHKTNYNNNEINSNNINNENRNFNEIFNHNLLEKENVKKCLEKLEENKTWLNKLYIYKNFNNNNKNLVNVCKNILDIFINSQVEKKELLIAYYEIKDILMDFSKIKLEKNLEDFNIKLVKTLCDLNCANRDIILAKEQRNELIKTTNSIDDLTELTVNNKNSYKNHFQENPKINSNENNILKNEEIFDNDENKKKTFSSDSINKEKSYLKTNNDISLINNTSNFNANPKLSESPFTQINNKTKQNLNRDFEAADKSKESLNIDIHSNRDSTENAHNKSHDSSILRLSVNKLPEPIKLKINNDSPFLPSKSLMRNPRSYTLILDLDETLVHFVEENDSAYIQIRPGAEQFLEEMSKYYEIVVFTAAMQDYADLVLNELDRAKCVSFRLYRQHTLMQNNFYLKDLEKLGRELEKMIIIDNVAENYKLQKENGINIKNFEGDEEDTELLDLIPDLIDIVINKVEDIRNKLPEVISKMNQRNKARLQARYEF